VLVVSVFVSHATEDSAMARNFVARLENEGIRCWCAYRDVDAADDFASQIVRAVNQSDVGVVLVSAYSNASPHVRRELESLVGGSKKIIPVRLDSAVASDAIAYFLRGAQWLDMTALGERETMDRVVRVASTGSVGFEPRPPIPFHTVLSQRVSDVGIKTRHPLATFALFCSSIIVLAPVGLILGLLYLAKSDRPPEGRLTAGWAVLLGGTFVAVAATGLILLRANR
jgi:hypothetical protein